MKSRRKKKPHPGAHRSLHANPTHERDIVASVCDLRGRRLAEPAEASEVMTGSNSADCAGDQRVRLMEACPLLRAALQGRGPGGASPVAIGPNSGVRHLSALHPGRLRAAVAPDEGRRPRHQRRSAVNLSKAGKLAATSAAIRARLSNRDLSDGAAAGAADAVALAVSVRLRQAGAGQFPRAQQSEAGYGVRRRGGSGDEDLALPMPSALLFRLVPYLPNGAAGWAADNLNNALLINVLLAVFNLLPIPPLDGSSGVAFGCCPADLRARSPRSSPTE